MSASPFVVLPSLVWLVKYRLFEGIPVEVLNAKLRLSARLFDWVKSVSTAEVFVVKLDNGPLRRSY